MSNNNLNLLNGDFALAGWEKSNRTGEVLIWRENYLVGILPDTEDTIRFNHLRSEELHKHAPELSQAAIETQLNDMHSTLFNLTSGDTLHIWLDCCPFDRVMLARLFHLLATHRSQATVMLTIRDVVWSKEEFLRNLNDAFEVTFEAIQIYESAWSQYRNGADPETLLSELFDVPCKKR